MLFLAELSEALRVPSEFRLLNGADPIIIGMGDDRGESLGFLKDVMAELRIETGFGVALEMSGAPAAIWVRTPPGCTEFTRIL